jgi:hypothetical protein
MKNKGSLTHIRKEVFGIEIREQKDTGFLNLSDLYQAYEYARVEHGWKEKRIDQVLNYDLNKKRTYYILKNIGIIDISLTEFLINGDTNYIQYLKDLGVYKTTGARNTKTTWCNPYIWIAAALELNPMFYAKTVTWLVDASKMVEILSEQLTSILKTSLNKLSVDNKRENIIIRAINYIIFGNNNPDVRSMASDEKRKKLRSLEMNISFLIDGGHIKTYDDLLEALRNLYKKKIK